MKFELAERKASNVPEETVLLLAAQEIRLISEALREGFGCEEIQRVSSRGQSNRIAPWVFDLYSSGDFPEWDTGPT